MTERLIEPGQEFFCVIFGDGTCGSYRGDREGCLAVAESATAIGLWVIGIGRMKMKSETLVEILD